MALHAVVTLIARDDASSRHWVSMLVDELDAIMAQLRASNHQPPRGMGTV